MALVFGVLATSVPTASAEIMPGGGRDKNFTVPAPGPNNEVWDVAVVPTGLPEAGKVYVVGTFTQWGGESRPRVARLNADGSLDATFNPGTGADQGVYTVAVIPPGTDDAGKVLIGGAFNQYNGSSRQNLTRLNADGSLDATFASDTGADATVWDIELVPNDFGALQGKFYVGGSFMRFGLVPGGNQALAGGVARLNANGSLDTTFDSSNGTNQRVNALAFVRTGTAAGGVVAVGSFTKYGEANAGRVVRLDAAGNRDANFPTAVGAQGGDVFAVKVLADNSVYIGGTFTTYLGLTAQRVARLTPTGELDRLAFPTASAANGPVYDIDVVPQGQRGAGSVYLVGSFTSYQGVSASGVVRVSANNVPDARFAVYAGAGSTVRAAAVVPSPLAGSGSLYIAGAFTSYGAAPGNTTSRVARIIPRPTGLQPTEVCGTPITPFPDVPPGSYFARGASCLLAQGVTNNNPYNPAGVVTRGQMAAFLWRFAGSPPAPASCGFTDEAAIADWARPGACWLKANGITTNNPYRPAAPVTREEMAAFLWRLAEKPTAETECGFIDEVSIAPFARQGACWLKENGITNNNPFQPASSVNRAQMAAFLYRAGATAGYWLLGFDIVSIGLPQQITGGSPAGPPKG